MLHIRKPSCPHLHSCLHPTVFIPLTHVVKTRPSQIVIQSRCTIRIPSRSHELNMMIHFQTHWNTIATVYPTPALKRELNSICKLGLIYSCTILQSCYNMHTYLICKHSTFRLHHGCLVYKSYACSLMYQQLF